ncbi:MAG: DNA polymerase IV [Candidatus Omnitrophica bacterium]|nr:DNA polymerase IV [Candidatus Omnitrophota bacterium]
MTWPRKIIHIDMDAFFAAIEQRDHPPYRGKPLIVGGDPASRGVVSTCSYEARKYGVHSAMPAAQAKKLCPQGIFIRPQFEKYSLVSRQVMAILRQHTTLVEPASLDEAYLDVTQHRFGIQDPVMIATLIKQNIAAVTQITASAGVAPNLFLAKIASDFQKPNGLTVVFPGQEKEFLKDLSVRKIPGVGPVTEKELQEENIYTCLDLEKAGPEFLRKHFGKGGAALYERSQGRDDREVEPEGESKQLSIEETFQKDTKSLQLLEYKLGEFSKNIYQQLKVEGRMGKTIVLKVKYFDFELITRSCTLEDFPANPETVHQIASRLLRNKTKAGTKAVRLLGLGLSNLETIQDFTSLRPRQAELF